MTNLSSLSTVDLTAVTGGQAINFDQAPEAAVQQVHSRIATCNALNAEALRLNPRHSVFGQTSASVAMKNQADECWKSLQGK